MNNVEEDIKKWIKYSDVSISVFWYTDTEQKYKGNIPTRIGPKYETAVIDKMFFDIDVLDKGGNLNKDCFDGYIALYDWAARHKYKRSVTFTSGGYQLCIGAHTRSSNYADCVRSVAQSTGAIIDPEISLASMMRYPGSFNFGRESKSTRNTYCIGLMEDEIHLPFHEHVKLATKYRGGLPTYGNDFYESRGESFIPKNAFNLDRRSDFTIDSSLSDIFLSYGYTYEDICPTIRNIIEQPKVGHMERLIIIKYMKSIMNIKYADMILILPKLLTAIHDGSNDGYHSIEEGQPSIIYNSNQHFSPFAMKKEGYCDSNCKICTDYLKEMNVW